MNDKQNILYKVVEIVASCCAYEIGGSYTIGMQDILGSSKRENVVWTRCMVVSQLYSMGFTCETIANLLSRTSTAVRQMLKKSSDLHETSYAYRVAEAQVILQCRSMIDDVCK